MDFILSTPLASSRLQNRSSGGVTMGSSNKRRSSIGSLSSISCASSVSNNTTQKTRKRRSSTDSICSARTATTTGITSGFSSRRTSTSSSIGGDDKDDSIERFRRENILNLQNVSGTSSISNDSNNGNSSSSSSSSSNNILRASSDGSIPATPRPQSLSRSTSAGDPCRSRTDSSGSSSSSNGGGAPSTTTGGALASPFSFTPPRPRPLSLGRRSSVGSGVEGSSGSGRIIARRRSSLGSAGIDLSDISSSISISRSSNSSNSSNSSGAAPSPPSPRRNSLDRFIPSRDGLDDAQASFLQDQRVARVAAAGRKENNQHAHPHAHAHAHTGGVDGPGGARGGGGNGDSIGMVASHGARGAAGAAGGGRGGESGVAAERQRRNSAPPSLLQEHAIALSEGLELQLAPHLAAPSSSSSSSSSSSVSSSPAGVPSTAIRSSPAAAHGHSTRQGSGGGGGGGGGGTAANQRQQQNQDRHPSHSSPRVLAFRPRVGPEPLLGHTDDLKVLYKSPSSSFLASSAFGGCLHSYARSRAIASSPTQILDAPDLLDDFYLNLMSWGDHNIIAVALNQTVYLWNAASGDITELTNVGQPSPPGQEGDEGGSSEANANDYVSSLKWIENAGGKGGSVLAVGLASSRTQLWDCDAEKRIRTLDGHTDRVSSLSWNGPVLSTGSRDGHIVNHDVRSRQHNVATLAGHTQEVCGLAWSPDGCTLASGGNDNIVNIWDGGRSGSSRGGGGQLGGQQRPKFTLTDHSAAVKALAWCPFQRGTLATGGGTADRCIKFWNASSGSLIRSLDTESQVCSLLWSSEEREIVSSHGFSQNQLCVWSYPSMAKIKSLQGHTSRVLHTALSPDGRTVVSAAGDETLRFWKIFGGKEKRGKSVHPGAPLSCGASLMSVR